MAQNQMMALARGGLQQQHDPAEDRNMQSVSSKKERSGNQEHADEEVKEFQHQTLEETMMAQ